MEDLVLTDYEELPIVKTGNNVGYFCIVLGSTQVEQVALLAIYYQINDT